MPNVKLFIDQTQYGQVEQGVSALLPELRDLLCRTLSVGPGACQIAVMPVMGLPDQPPINVEMQLMPKDGRTPDMLRQAGMDLRACLHAATGLHVAVRISALDPASYIALK
ncbi:hypothetical protein [Roseicitreum antarcticum]|uniref:5-carboxymethyl-2-hydroxymuconate isomerase n=1 Tax=Roseicitreum antarcticum TaxID=564137 RepID=A0A1H2YP13_9RHOB|nr:hypothetical protein [Roseicitreum antarcticum]SDX06936.1 hypothetical protein SAMN04488238_10581 [Roseicitreum antarcticum]